MQFPRRLHHAELACALHFLQQADLRRSSRFVTAALTTGCWVPSHEGNCHSSASARNAWQTCLIRCWPSRMDSVTEMVQEPPPMSCRSGNLWRLQQRRGRRLIAAAIQARYRCSSRSSAMAPPHPHRSTVHSQCFRQQEAVVSDNGTIAIICLKHIRKPDKR